MKNLMTHLMIAAAALTATAASAPAQSIKAEVPFTFRANGKLMPPGAYRFEFQNRTGIPLIRVYGEGGGIAMLPTNPHDPKKEWVTSGQGLLSFECGVSQCTLTGIWGGPHVDLPAYSLPAGKPTKDEPVRTALIPAQPVTR